MPASTSHRMTDRSVDPDARWRPLRDQQTDVTSDLVAQGVGFQGIRVGASRDEGWDFKGLGLEFQGLRVGVSRVRV